jgi:hypothetical protein
MNTQSEEYLTTEIQDEEYPEVGTPVAEHSEPQPRSVTVRLDSLITLFFGLMLGIVIGFMGRPLVTSQPQTAPVAPATGPTSASQPAGQSKAAQTSAKSAGTQARLDNVVAQTRHFKGDPNAPVTVIEFGDFQ